ncbi:hypothetical protein BO71DRAFT_402348 [Aspergillus ellipticus CBS 707.79]|uniref:Uncharacterized protein n=1 Tax=Aspergillus ellipticus CBS 707.79 TaxID=1448320 RepID=A0A319D6R5_9EURO|nr:hypothetical protein BO71DRAFT_402348 [Aspergillus ellipticus CBS 707.79]
MTVPDQPPQTGIKRSNTIVSSTGRILRSPSITAATNFLQHPNPNPPGGVWQATGTAIAYALNITDVESAEPTNVYSASRSTTQDGRIVRRATAPAISMRGASQQEHFTSTESETASVERLISAGGHSDERIPAPEESWRRTVRNLSVATWAFIKTPIGLFIAIYGLNVVAWGAMLFFLMLNVGSMSKEKKKEWIEIDSQVLNALFCLTSWGLAPWRCRDMYWLLVWRVGSSDSRRSTRAIMRLAARNETWFRVRVPEGSSDEEEEEEMKMPLRNTRVRRVAPPTKPWKMDFVVVNLLLNSLFQVGMATFMWLYNRHNRPGFAVGLFMGLGCFSAMMAGGMSWWEGRKVKLMERPRGDVEGW